MNTDTKNQTKFIYSDLAEKAIEIGRQKHWRFRVVGQGPVPAHPFYRGAWWFEPVKELPKGKDRLGVLRASGIDFKGFVVAHEVVLVETKEDVQKTIKKETDFKVQTPDILPVVGSVLQVVFGVLLLMVEVAMIDPSCICVLSDHSWLEVINYYE